MDIALSRIRDRPKGNQQSQAKILNAIESVLDQSKTEKQPTSYFMAIISTLEVTQDQSTKSDLISILSIILPFLSKPILIQNSKRLFKQLLSQPFPPTKPIIVIIQYLLNNLSTSILTQQNEPKELFKTSLLPLISSPTNPKLRRQVHLALSSLTIEHPYSKDLSNHILNQFSLISLDTHQALSLLSLSIESIHLLSPEPTVKVLLNLLKQTHLSTHPFVAERLFDLLDKLVGSLSEPQILLLALVDKPPEDDRALVGWLATLERAWLAWSKISPGSVEQALNVNQRIPKLILLLNHDSSPVRNSVRSTLESIIRTCFTNQSIEKTVEFGIQSKTGIQQMIESFEEILSKLDEWTTSTEELSSVIESLISRLREPINGIPAAIPLLQNLIKPLSQNRERNGIESVIGKISSVCGPEIIFKELPLNILEDDTNSWTLALLGKPGYVINTELNHFMKVLVPLSEQLFERRRIALKEEMNLEAKKCEIVVNQIWALLPGYCDLPRDLIQSFTKPFAELLSQILYTQPTLRSSVLRALRNLVDRNLSLSKSVPEPADLQLIRNFGISSKDAQENIQHLSSLGSNMSKVMFNLLSKLERKDPVRSLLVETIGSWIKVLSENDFNQIWSIISTTLKRSSTQSQDPNNKLPTTLEIMLDIYSILLPRLPTSIANESLELIGSDQFLMGLAQKKAYRILGLALEFGKLSKEGIESLMKRVILIGRDHPKEILSGAKPDRSNLLLELMTKINSNRFDLMVLMISEVVLGCKETNSETREIAYKTLVRMGNRMKDESHAIINQKLLEDESDMGEAVVVQASIDEFLKIISAGLAGGSPHMIAATMMALSRVIFEFHNDLSNESIQEILRIVLIFLNSSNNREIIKTTISLIKVCVICLPTLLIKENLNSIIKGLVKWGDEHKNEIKKNVKFLLERLIKKFEFNLLIKALESSNEDDEEEGEGIDLEGGKKLLGSIKKNYEREKKKKKESVKRRKERELNGDEIDEDEEDDDVEERVGGRLVKKNLNDAYEQALYGSDDSESEDEDQQKKKKGKGKGKQPPKGIEMMIDESDDEVIDLLDPSRITKRAIAGKLAKLEKRKNQLSNHAKKFEKDTESGKMKIEEEEEIKEEIKKTKKQKVEESEGFNAYLEAIEGEDGMYRDEKGKMKFKKPSNHSKRNLDDLSDGENEIELKDLVNGLDLNSKNNKKKKVKKEKLGSEFKSKKAGGDMIQKKGVSPFAYLPMNDVSGKRGKKRKGEIDITGKKRGSASK